MERRRFPVFGSMDRCEEESPWGKAGAIPVQGIFDLRENGGVADIARDARREILHQVADELHPIAQSLGGKIRDGRGRRGEKPARETVGHQAIDLLGHLPVEAAQAGLDVRDGDAQLHGSEGSRQRGVRIAIDQHGVGPFGDQDWLEARKHCGGLNSMRATADAQAPVWPRQAQLAEEHPGQLFVPMLAGVHEQVLVARAQRGQQGRGLDQLGTSPDDADDAHERRTRQSDARSRA